MIVAASFWRPFAPFSLAFTLVSNLSGSTAAHAHSATADINAELNAFRANPKRAMNELPLKRDARSGQINSRTAFSTSEISTHSFVEKKDSVRKKMCTVRNGARVCLSEVLPGRAPFDVSDLAENLADNGSALLRTLESMEEHKLTHAALAETPWSDDYWPIYTGLLAHRYADPEFPRSEDWNENLAYATALDSSFAAIVNAANASSIDDLSPAEKYDLLVGDGAATLTQAMWATGKTYFRRNGRVETWMGICNGWAPASYMIARPQHGVELLAADGKTKITFYPSDIKGLASLLWANSNTTSRFIGNRCDDKYPDMDENGRLTSDECFDTNPGTWHLTAINQIGVSKRSMVIDATYDYQVWNQPVYAYSYTYFNPQSGVAVDDLASAKVAIKEFTADKFAKYRSKDAVAVVGVSMELTYVSETEPTHSTLDSPEHDRLTVVRYTYDLELNDKGEIIGGEWYRNAHPDFIWTPTPTTHAVSPGDALATDNWGGQGAMPESWRKAAVLTSKAKMPLAKVVELLSTLGRL